MSLRTRSLRFALSAFSASLALAYAGCDSGGSSSTGGTTTGTDTGDGHYHPEPNGTHITEKAACDALVNVQGKQLLALSCVGTGQTCPAFLRSEFKTACMEYDEGSVSGCIAYYKEQTSCDGLKNAIEACIVTSYPGTEPAGCPLPDGGGGTGGTGGTMTGSGGTMTGTGGTGGTMTGTGGTMTGSGGATSGSGTGGGMSSGGM